MKNFGFVSSSLAVESSWDFFVKLLPEKWRYRNGPLYAGMLTSLLSGTRIDGFGWKVPDQTSKIWNPGNIVSVWENLSVELDRHEIGIIGIDSGSSFNPPPKLFSQKHLSGISDGKALELLLFINYFRRLLRNYEIMPQYAKAMVIWEEGNLGLVCARLIAREVRYLTLVNPDFRYLERAADLLLTETGVSPQISTFPPDLKGNKIVIKCGKLSKYYLPHNIRPIICCELFQKNQSLRSLNVNLPITVSDARQRLPLYPALGETILRSFFNLPGIWYGTELRLERILKLADLIKELGVQITV